jgi:hypothetical protein
VEILPKTTGGVEPDFSEHARKILEAGGLLERAAGKCSGIGRVDHFHDSVVSAALSMDRDFPSSVGPRAAITPFPKA